MNRSGGEAFARLAQQLRKARLQAGGGGGGGRGSGGSGPNLPNIPTGGLFGGGLIFLLVGGGLLINASLFNVDGGHRAIMYSRLYGVMTKIYPEGTHLRVSTRFCEVARQLTLSDPMARDPSHLRCPCKA